MSCRWLTVSQAAEHLGVAHSTVFRWCKQGKLTYMQMGPMGKILVCKTLPEHVINRAGQHAPLVNEGFVPESEY